MNFNIDEKALILVTSFVANPTINSVSSEVLALGLQQMLAARKFDYSLQKITDMIMSVKAEQQQFIQDGFNKLQNMSNRYD